MKVVISKAFKLIKTKIVYCIIISLLFCIAIAATNYSLFTDESAKLEIKASESLANNNLVYVHRMLSDGVSPAENSDILNMEGVKAVYKVNGGQRIKVGDTQAVLFGFDSDLLKIFSPKLIVGRLPEKNESIIEIAAMTGDFEIEKTYQVNGKNVKVVGLFDRVLFVPKASTSATSELYLVNIVASYNGDFERYPAIIGLNSEFETVLTKYHYDRNVFVEYEEGYLNENGESLIDAYMGHGTAELVEDIYNRSVASNKSRQVVTVTVSVITALACLILLTINTLALLNKKGKYLSTLYLNGFSVANIVAIIAVAYLLIAIGGILLGEAISLILLRSFKVLGIGFGLWSYLIPVILIAFVVTEAVAIVVIKLKSGSISESIKEENED